MRLLLRLLLQFLRVAVVPPLRLLLRLLLVAQVPVARLLLRQLLLRLQVVPE